MARARLLLVEDDELLGATLLESLQSKSYFVDWSKNGKDAFEKLTSDGRAFNHYDLLILDWMLPEMDGLSVMKELRHRSRIPVLMISARGHVNDRIQGLKHQVDDFLPKPFHLEEFFLRIQNLLRRANDTATTAIEEETIGEALVRFQNYEIIRQGVLEKLTEKEMLTLQLLRNRNGVIVNRHEIVELVWGTSEFPSVRTVDNVIVRLRKLIEKDPSDPKWILSHHGLGYSLRRTL